MKKAAVSAAFFLRAIRRLPNTLALARRYRQMPIRAAAP